MPHLVVRWQDCVRRVDDSWPTYAARAIGKIHSSCRRSAPDDFPDRSPRRPGTDGLKEVHSARSQQESKWEVSGQGGPRKERPGSPPGHTDSTTRPAQHYTGPLPAWPTTPLLRPWSELDNFVLRAMLRRTARERRTVLPLPSPDHSLHAIPSHPRCLGTTKGTRHNVTHGSPSE